MASKTKMPIVVQADCANAAEAAQVQAFIQELLNHNGAKGLLNLKEKMDGSKLIRNQVLSTLNS